jgi:hypothetical protein
MTSFDGHKGGRFYLFRENRGQPDLEISFPAIRLRFSIHEAIPVAQLPSHLTS